VFPNTVKNTRELLPFFYVIFVKRKIIMSKKLICLVTFTLLLGLALTSTANADDPNLVGWWRFDGDFTDSSGNGNHGEPGNGIPIILDPARGQVASFDGVDDCVTVSPDAWSSIEKQVTLAFWAYGDPVLQHRTGFAFDARQNPDVKRSRVAGVFLPYQDGIVYWDAGVIGESFDRINKAATAEEYEGSWQHWAFTKDADAGEMKIYLNGVLWHSGTGKTRTMTGVTAFKIGSWADGSMSYAGMIDDFHLCNRALTEQEINRVMTTGRISPPPPGPASNPNPFDGATDAPWNAVLSWTPGEYAKAVNGHTVYFSENFDDVNDADAVGGVAQTDASYTPAQRLDFGKTYYWRVDEVSAPPDYTIFKGDVWSFTVEPVGYPIAIENITATASSLNKADEGPENTINGSGLDDDDLHSSENTAMWLSSAVDPNPWIQYEFDRAQKLYQMQIWNYNSSVELIVGFGIKEATIEYSVDGTNWTILGTTHEFARGPGSAGYAPNTTIDLGGVAARYVKITANSNWGGIVNQYGLSEVCFLYVPVFAREPSPDSGATDVDVDRILSFRAGREAAKHDVYLGTDEQAVIDGNAPVASVTEAGYVPSLDLAGTYYWRIDEVNDAEIPTTWRGDTWNLSTQEYLVVDDFESYNDIPAGQEGSNLVYGTWVDGFENPANGSTIGYYEPFQPTIETSIVYDGEQSVPLFYDNTVATYSEVTAKVADLDVGGDWSAHGIKALTLRFLGDPNNVAQQMYVKINGSRLAYEGDAENLKRTGWQMWYIDLASIGVSLSNVTELAIGFERIGAVGGQGMVLLDDIRLYSYDRQLFTPVDPGTTGLQAHYEFEGTTNDSSGNARHGTAMGNPVFVVGKIGQAISFDFFNDYVKIDGYKGITATNDLQPAFSIACWMKTNGDGDGTMVSWGSSDGAPIGGQNCTFRIVGGKLRVQHGDGNLSGNTRVDDDEWHHSALTVVEGGNLMVPNTILYVDGQQDTVSSGSGNIYNITADADVNIGRRASHEDQYFNGLIDDARIYNRVLSKEEIAWLADRITPCDKPF